MWYATYKNPGRKWKEPKGFLLYQNALKEMKGIADDAHFIITPSREETGKRMAAGEPPSVPSALNKG